MRTWLSAACVSTALLLAAGEAVAQNAAPVVPSIGFELITGQIESGAAEAAGTGTRTWGAQANGALTLYRFVSFGAELGLVDMVDERPFTEETTEGERTSGVSSFYATFTTGLRTPRVALSEGSPVTASAGLNAGYTWLTTERLIPSCSDCHSEDVEIGAGAFWEPAVQLNRGRGGLTARYRIYGGDSNWENALMIGYSWTIAPRHKTREETAPEQ